MDHDHSSPESVEDQISVEDASSPEMEDIQLPGLELPIDYMPDDEHCFPILTGDPEDGWRAVTLLRREACMLRVMESLTNKPEWCRKVHDPTISDKWKKEMLEMPWEELMDFGDFTKEMADAVIAELRKKAEIYEKTGLIPVMDYSACVLKSDKILEEDQELVNALKKAVAPLENVPEEEKDWHPGSDNKVLDLVHPSLYPLVYGRSRVALDEYIYLAQALESCGIGTVLDGPKDESVKLSQHMSRKFQWLPCDVLIQDGKPKIDTYVNNLHPEDHADMYPVIEKFIEKSLPAWDLVYRWPRQHQLQRLACNNVRPGCTVHNIESPYTCDCRPTARPLEKDEEERTSDEEHWESWYEGSEREKLDIAWYIRTHKFDIPQPDVNADYYKLQASDVLSEGFFDGESRIQVIVKLANIHLTPESPDYDGGGWHVEGQLNEHIVASALFYYDCENVTECNLGFRVTADAEQLSTELDYEQGDDLNIRRAFAIDNVDDINQEIGSVLTRPNRALFFPNLYQHRVAPFKLADPSKPGHRKILALFLVDPAIPIISTANIPPQQRDWWVRQVDNFKDTKIMSLPPEIRSQVESEVHWPIDHEEAKQTRLELMAERSRLTEEKISRLADTYNFCEH